MQLDIFTEPNSTKRDSAEPNFLIYKSSAGSGKTYTLVKEYLKIVLNNPDDYKHTLAITFTNKAAEEMKSRVVQRLVELSKGESHTLRELLAEEGVAGNIQEKSQQVLSKILHDYSHFSITTIDSFFHLVIRSFARELKLQLGYNVELEEEIVLEQVVAELLDSAGNDDELRKYIEEYIFYNIEQSRGWKIDLTIKKLGKEIFNEKYWEKFEGREDEIRNSRKTINNLIPKLFEIVKEFESSITEFGKKALKIISDFNLEVSDFFGGRNSIMLYPQRMTSNKAFIDSKKINPTDTLRKVLSGEKNWFAQASTKKEQIRKSVEGGLGRVMKEMIEYFDSNLKKYFTAKEVLKTIYVLGIFKDLHEKLKSYRDENKTLLISDTNRLLKSVISEENSPFIYERIGNQFKNFLIDEFQDTSNYQWANLLPLLINSLGEGHKVIIVGDVKQSIYRFRGGNMKLLTEKVHEDLQAFGCEEKKLLDNRRSRKEIVKFNNEFFPKVTESMAVEIEDEYKKLFLNSYKEIIQHDTFSNEGGYVKIQIIPYDKDSETGTEEIADKKVIENISEALSDKYELKDILILTRDNKDNSRIAHLLSANNIRVISSESLLVSGSPGVKLMLSVLKYISDNQNALAMTEVLYQYLSYIKNETTDYHKLFTDHNVRENKIFFSILPRELFNSARTHINPSLTKLPLYDLTECLIRIFSIGENPDSYLLRFLDVIIDYTQKFSTDINSFVQWWENNADKHSIVVPQNENAVRVLTIHKAKGLESPVVIIPYCNWSFRIKSDNFIWSSCSESPFDESPAFVLSASEKLRETYFEKDYEEESALTKIDNLNLLYVAFTRAKDRLYVLCPEEKSYGKSADKKIHSAVSLMNGFNQQTNIFECGIKEKNEAQSNEQNIYQTDKIYFTDFTKKLVLKTQGISPELKKSLDKGNLLHKALAYIRNERDVAKAAERLSAEGLLSDSDKISFAEELKSIITHPEAKDWFSDKFKIRIEAEMILPGGKIIRPDRVMLKNDEAILVDYKTGEENENHKQQLNLYADALLKSGIKKIEKYLYYITQKKVLKIE